MGFGPCPRVDEVDGHVVEHDTEVVPLVERGLEAGEVEAVTPIGERLLHPVLVGAVLPLVVAVVAGPAGTADPLAQVGDGRVGELDAELLGLHVQQNDTMPTTPLGPPLAGVRVLDLSQVLAGPVCGRILADLGADVIKIEAPQGDLTREVLPLVNGQSLYYTHANAGKRGVGVDLRTEHGAALVGDSRERADVFIENFRPGVLARRGLGADDLLARTRASCTARSAAGVGTVRGQTGRRTRRWCTPRRVASSSTARLRDAPPAQELHSHGDINAACSRRTRSSRALFQRERTGAGQHLDVSMAEALVYTDEWTLHRRRRVRARADPRHLELPDLHASPTAPTSRWWATRCALVQIAAATRRRRASSPDDHAKRRGDPCRRSWRGCPTSPRWRRCSSRPGFLVSEVRIGSDLADTPWAEARGLFVEVEPDTRGGGRAVPVRPRRRRRTGPGAAAGEHRGLVLTELLGLDDADLDDCWKPAAQCDST